MTSSEQALRTGRGGAIPQPGDLVGGKYRVERYVGHGGMGVVMRATHEQLGKIVALKVLRPGRVADDEAVKRFLREARAASAIDSEHIARVVDLGTHDGLPFMVLELLTGRGLDQVLKNEGAIAVPRAVNYLLQACIGVADAHAHGIIHRDLKPSNLFLAERPDGREVLKVLDFGVSKITALGGATEDVSCLTETNAAIGSPFYMSPEQLRSSKTVDARSDVWALGIILYRLLCAHLPFDAPNIGAYLGMIVASPIIALRRRNPSIPAGLETIIERCLAKKPADRYQDVADLARDLAPFAGPRGAMMALRVKNALDAPLDNSSSLIPSSPPSAPPPPPEPTETAPEPEAPPPPPTQPIGAADPMEEVTVRARSVPRDRPTQRMLPSSTDAFEAPDAAAPSSGRAPTSVPPPASLPPSASDPPPPLAPDDPLEHSMPSVPPADDGATTRRVERKKWETPPWEQASGAYRSAVGGSPSRRWLTVVATLLTVVAIAATAYVALQSQRAVEAEALEAEEQAAAAEAQRQRDERVEAPDDAATTKATTRGPTSEAADAPSASASAEDVPLQREVRRP